MATSLHRRREAGRQARSHWATMDEEESMGYEATFYPELELRFACPVCLVALKDPVQTKCGHRFCRVCLARSSRSMRYAKCPVDNTWFDTSRDVFPDLAMNREVLSLSVKCDNAMVGCNWSGELRHLQTHTRKCLCAPVPCPNECGVTCKRGELESHLLNCRRRLQQCQHCKEDIIVADLTKHQLLICPKFPVSCSVCGETGIIRENIPSHVDHQTGDCPLVVVKCSYEHIGCYFQDRRKNMLKHHQKASNHHILLLSIKLAQQEDFIHRQNQEIRHLTSTCDHLSTSVRQHEGTLRNQSRILDDVENDLSDHLSTSWNGSLLWKIVLGNDTNVSPPIFTGRPGYRFHLKFELHGHREDEVNYSSVYVCLENSHMDYMVNYPVDAICEMKILDQSADVTSHRHLESSIVCRQLPRPTEGGIVQRSQLKMVPTETLLSGRHVKDNIIFISAEIKLTSDFTDF